MSTLIALLLSILIIWGCIAWARHLNGQDRKQATPSCAHQRVRVLDGELDECGKCGERT